MKMPLKDFRGNIYELSPALSVAGKMQLMCGPLYKDDIAEYKSAMNSKLREDSKSGIVIYKLHTNVH